MNTVRILHTADLHLDSPFDALSSGKAAIRRSEQRELLKRIATLSQDRAVDIVLMAGDLFDSLFAYRETTEELERCLKSISVPVFISPGNHDFYSAKSPYAKMDLPANVRVFAKNEIECVELKSLGVRIYGAAFVDRHSGALLENFRVKKEPGVLDIMCLHGEVGAERSDYDPISEKEIAESGLDYLALGHVHKASGLKKAGNTWYSWPGCPEGRGFDECGEKYINIVTLGEGECLLEQVPAATRKYEIMNVDVTATDPLLAIHTQLPDDTVHDVYRIVLTGESGASIDLNKLKANLSEYFFELQLRDETHIRRDIWERSGEDTLRGLFLEKLRKKYDAALTDEEKAMIEQAARWGLAALDNMEEVAQHEDQ